MKRKIQNILHEKHKNPNVAILRNYFRKIKSLPQDIKRRVEPKISATTTIKTINEYNATTTNNSATISQLIKQKVSPKRREKVFLTVNDAFSHADYGREMREPNQNYLMYIPIEQNKDKDLPTPPNKVRI